MKILINWIRRNQIVAFFLITFGITWGLGFSYFAVLVKEQGLFIPLGVIATCGPALAGIIITSICYPQIKLDSRKVAWRAFLVAFVVSFLIHQLCNVYIGQMPINLGTILFSITAATPVAYIISLAYSRNKALNTYLSSLVQLRGRWIWLLLALVLIPGLYVLSIQLKPGLINSILISQSYGTGAVLVGLIAIRFFYQLFFFNAFGEEIGWRGFALPRLQGITSPLMSSLIIGFFWVIWHFFLYKAQGLLWFSWKFWLDGYIQVIPLSVMITWLYNRSKGSILVAGIAHAASNTTMIVLMPGLERDHQTVIMYVAVVLLVIVGKMWKKLPADHPAVFRDPIDKEPVELELAEGIVPVK